MGGFGTFLIDCSFWVTFHTWSYVWCLNCAIKTSSRLSKKRHFCILLSSSQGGSECVSTKTLASSISKAYLYMVAVEHGEGAQLCVFILGMRYLYPGVQRYPGVLRRVFGYRCALSVLVALLLFPDLCFLSAPMSTLRFQA